MMIVDTRKIIGKITDVHTHSVGAAMGHLLSGKYPFSQDIVDLSEMVRANGIAFAVTFPMVPSVYYNAREIRYNQIFIETGNCDYPYELENRDLLKIIDEFRLDNLIAFLSFSVRCKVREQIESMDELSKQYRVYGLKYHALSDHMPADNPCIYPFVEFALERNIPIMIHSDRSPEADPVHVLRLAEKFPDLRLCVAHGGHFIPEFWAELNEHTNVFTDCSPLLRLLYDKVGDFGDSSFSNFPPSDVIQIMYDRAPRHLLWGTDIPFFRFMDDDGHLIRYEDEVKTMIDSGLINEISVNTARFLFGESD